MVGVSYGTHSYIRDTPPVSSQKHQDKRLQQRLREGRLKVARQLEDFLKEYRTNHRDQTGRIVKQRDHVCDATRYALVSLRMGRIKAIVRKLNYFQNASGVLMLAFDQHAQKGLASRKLHKKPAGIPAGRCVSISLSRSTVFCR